MMELALIKEKIFVLNYVYFSNIFSTFNLVMDDRLNIVVQDNNIMV
jgi:hypothetical protein